MIDAKRSFAGYIRSPELGAAFPSQSRLIWLMVAISAVLNLLMLAGAVFMLLVYDEVLPSRSIPTLLGLLFLVMIAFVFQGVLDHLRGRIMTLSAQTFTSALDKRALAATLDGMSWRADAASAPRPFRDLDQIGQFIASPGAAGLLDLPWTGIYLAVLFLFHPLLGAVTLFGMVVMIGVAIATDRIAGHAVADATRTGVRRHEFAEMLLRNVDTLRALGMRARMLQIWTSLADPGDGKRSAVLGALRSTGKSLRIFLQSLILACGAWLVINDLASGGVIIASAIISSRALAPIEAAIANWRSLEMSRQAWNRLAGQLETFPEAATRTQLPPPACSLSVEAVSVVVPGSNQLLLRDVSFALGAGETLGIIGASGSGKTTLAKTLVGLISPAAGVTRLDGAALDQWRDDEIGGYFGYLPQDVELFEGSVAHNIARFDPDASGEQIVAAAEAADVHKLILQLPNGYDTVIGPGGRTLSAGQRQRIALARALFRDPFVIVLDEPNSNLDGEGDIALSRAVARARARGAIVIMVAHRSSAIAEIGKLLWLENGRVKAIGPKADVLPRLAAVPTSPSASPSPSRAARASTRGPDGQ